MAGLQVSVYHVSAEEEDAVGEGYNLFGNDWGKIYNYMRTKDGPFSYVYNSRSLESCTRRLRKIVNDMMAR